MNNPLNHSDSFVDTIGSLGNAALSNEIVHHAKRCLLDYLGATFAGAAMIREKNERLLNQLGGVPTGTDQLDAGHQLVKVIGMNRKADLLLAALVNGISSHQAELDDGVISGIVHPGTPVFSAILPWAQVNRTDGRRLLQGIIAGYEATVRIALAVQPSHKRRGFHATGTCGTIGAALALSMMAGAKRKEMKDTLSAAAVSAAGTLKVLEDDSELKPFNSGQAAVSALMAFSLARSGFQGPHDVLAGQRGFLEMMSEEYDVHQLDAVSERLAIESVYFKPFAACRYCHPAIEAAIELKRRSPNQTVELDLIERITVSTYELAVHHHDHTHVSSVASAKMSIPYSVAVALVTGRAGMHEYQHDKIRDPSLKGLMQKIHVLVDDQYTAEFPQKTAARVEIQFKDGRIGTVEILDPKGDPTNPMKDNEVSDKFTTLMDYANVPTDQVDRLHDAVWDLPRNPQQIYDNL